VGLVAQVPGEQLPQRIASCQPAAAGPQGLIDVQPIFTGRGQDNSAPRIRPETRRVVVVLSPVQDGGFRQWRQPIFGAAAALPVK
jgi:hypothetical protein